MVNVLRKWWVWPILIVLVMSIVFTLLPAGSTAVERPLTAFVEDAKAGRVRSVEVHGSVVEYRLKGDEQTFKSRMERDDTVRQVLQDSGIDPEDFPPIEVRAPRLWSNLPGLLFQFLPIIFIIGTLYFFLRRARAGTGSRTAEVDPVCGKRVGAGDATGTSTFADVAYRFCSLECKQMFDADPVRYLLKS